MLCHHYSHVSPFHTVTLRFLGTELIYVIRPVCCVHRFLFSFLLARSIFLRGVILVCQFTVVYSQKEVTLQFPDDDARKYRKYSE